jgi:hypothetical protein
MSTDLTISASARKCRTSFDRLQILAPDPECQDEDNIEEFVEDSRGRFNVWAANIGALHPSRSKVSLDSRLGDAPLMRSSVISGLERLQRSETRSMIVASISNRKQLTSVLNSVESSYWGTAEQKSRSITLKRARGL